MAKYTYKPISCAQALATQQGTQMLARMSQPHLGAWWPIEQRFDFIKNCCKLGHVQHCQLRTFQSWRISNYPDPMMALAYSYAGIGNVELKKVEFYLWMLRNYILGLHGCHQSVLVMGSSFEIGGWSRNDRRLAALKQYIETVN